MGTRPLLIAALLGSAGCVAAIGDSADEPSPTSGDPSRPTSTSTSTSTPGRPTVTADRPAAPPPPSAACAGRIPAGPAVLRRLTGDELANSARDLLALRAATSHLDPSAGAIITELEVEKLHLAVAELAATKGHHAYVPCAIDGAHDAVCAAKFVDAFGKVAFRRPLEPTERTWLLGVYDEVRQTAGVSPAIGFRESIDTVAQVILQSPQHVYLHEQGVADPALPAGVRRLSGFERAARLSYLLWSSTPDRALMEAAEKGRLDTGAGVRAEAERLLASPRARTMVRAFASSWLELDGTQHHPPIEQFEKNAKKFPFDAPALRAAFRAETEALYERVFFEERGGLRALVTSTKAYVDAPLAQLYGVTGGPRTGSDAAWVDLDPARRAGIFTRAAFLSLQASAEWQSPVLRGTFLYRHALCLPLPDPPADADNTPPAPAPASGRSVRALTDAKTMTGACSSCHALINPIGYALEHYDAMGRYQTHEPGNVPVDASATIAGTDLAGPVQGGVALSARLADSATARACIVDRWFARALSRTAGAEDACLVDSLKQRFQASDDLQDLVVTIASSDAALHVKEEP